MNIPNCVPEYYRSKFEDEAHEAELEMQRLDWYEQNKAYRAKRENEGCREIAFYPDECEHCALGEVAMPTWEGDDWPVKICSGWESCPVYKREMEMKTGSSEDENEYPDWLMEEVIM